MASFWLPPSVLELDGTVKSIGSLGGLSERLLVTAEMVIVCLPIEGCDLVYNGRTQYHIGEAEEPKCRR